LRDIRERRDERALRGIKERVKGVDKI
jgi:hypothetical protein